MTSPEEPTTGLDPTSEPPVLNPMYYIDTPPERVHLHKAVERAISNAYDTLRASCPESAERTLAIRKLQEARMWANAAIVFDGKRYPT